MQQSFFRDKMQQTFRELFRIKFNKDFFRDKKQQTFSG